MDAKRRLAGRARQRWRSNFDPPWLYAEHLDVSKLLYAHAEQIRRLGGCLRR
jgi:hypothetical protein